MSQGAVFIRREASSKGRSTSRRQAARPTTQQEASSKVRPTTRRQAAPSKVRPTTRRTLHALGGRRVMIEGFGKRSPTLVVIGGNGEAPAGAWLSPAALRRLIEVARRILK